MRTLHTEEQRAFGFTVLLVLLLTAVLLGSGQFARAQITKEPNSGGQKALSHPLEGDARSVFIAQQLYLGLDDEPVLIPKQAHHGGGHGGGHSGGGGFNLGSIGSIIGSAAGILRGIRNLRGHGRGPFGGGHYSGSSSPDFGWADDIPDDGLIFGPSPQQATTYSRPKVRRTLPAAHEPTPTPTPSAQTLLDSSTGHQVAHAKPDETDDAGDTMTLDNLLDASPGNPVKRLSQTERMEGDKPDSTEETDALEKWKRRMEEHEQKLEEDKEKAKQRHLAAKPNLDPGTPHSGPWTNKDERRLKSLRDEESKEQNELKKAIDRRDRINRLIRNAERVHPNSQTVQEAGNTRRKRAEDAVNRANKKLWDLRNQIKDEETRKNRSVNTADSIKQDFLDTDWLGLDEPMKHKPSAPANPATIVDRMESRPGDSGETTQSTDRAERLERLRRRMEESIARKKEYQEQMRQYRLSLKPNLDPAGPKPKKEVAQEDRNKKKEQDNNKKAEEGKDKKDEQDRKLKQALDILRLLDIIRRNQQTRLPESPVAGPQIASQGPDLPGLPDEDLDDDDRVELPLNWLWRMYTTYWPTARAGGEGYSFGQRVADNKRLRRLMREITEDAVKKQQFHSNHVLETDPKIDALDAQIAAIDAKIKAWDSAGTKHLTPSAREIRDKKLTELNGKKNAAQAERSTLEEFRDYHNRRYEEEKKRFEAADDYLTDLKKNPSHIPETRPPR